MAHYSTTVVGLDVHKDSIVAAVLPPRVHRVALTTKFQNQPSQVERFIRSLVPGGDLEFVYEAGPCGYEIHRQISALGQRCVVIAPGLTPQKPGDRVKTDRRDAEKLAQLHSAGQLTAVRVPSREEESARDIVRVREDILEDRLRARNRLSKMLLRQGLVWRETKSWGVSHRSWLRTLRFDFLPSQQSFDNYLHALEEAERRLSVLDQQILDLAQREPYATGVSYLRCLKGVDTLSALTLLVEVHDFMRFPSAREFMGYTGLVSREHSSADSVRRGGITKVGNAHVRRILVEAAWGYTRGAKTGKAVEDRRVDCPQAVVAIARKAQDRLSRKFGRMAGRGKAHQVALIAVSRELAGFVWAIARLIPRG